MGCERCTSLMPTRPSIRAFEVTTTRILRVAILSRSSKSLLVHSIQLRDLYKYARLQAADSRFRLLFDAHYKEQLRVVDALIDRMRMLAATGRVFASDFLQGTQFFRAQRGRWSLMGLLRNLLERHELVLMRGAAGGARRSAPGPMILRVGQVVLTNDLQAWSLSELVALPRDNED